MTSFTRRTALAAAAGLAATAAMSACGSGGPYAPAAYGANGQCYYLDDPREVAALQAAGLCPVNWIPMAAPVWYRARYADFFASPAYYDHYVPVSVRKTYVTHVTVWNKNNAGAVDTQRKAVQVARNSSSYNSGNARGDRAGGTSKSTYSGGSRVSVGSSSGGRSFSSGSRK